MAPLKRQFTAVYILWLRQLKRHFQSKWRITASLAQPLLLLFAFGFGFGPVFAKAGGGDYREFLTPGIVGMSVLFSAMFGGVELISDKQFGFLKETLVAPVSRLAIMAGRSLGGTTVAVFQGVMVLVIAMAFGFRPATLAGLLTGLLFMFLIAAFFSALGTAFASLMDDMHAYPIIMNFILMPMFFLSGSLFPLDGLPRVFSYIVKANPLTYGIDGLRAALTGAAQIGMGTDLIVLSSITILILFIGSYLFTKIEA